MWRRGLARASVVVLVVLGLLASQTLPARAATGTVIRVPDCTTQVTSSLPTGSTTPLVGLQLVEPALIIGRGWSNIWLTSYRTVSDGKCSLLGAIAPYTVKWQDSTQTLCWAYRWTNPYTGYPTSGVYGQTYDSSPSGGSISYVPNLVYGVVGHPTKATVYYWTITSGTCSGTDPGPPASDSAAFWTLACAIGEGSNGISPGVLMGVAKVESDYGRLLGPSSAGAYGPYQFLASTWRTWGRDYDAGAGATSTAGWGAGDPARVDDSMASASAYLRYLVAQKGGVRQALLAYNGASSPNGYDQRVLDEASQYPSSGCTGGGPGGHPEPSEDDGGLSACVPTGWQILNPMSYVKATGCLLHWAFVPEGDGLESHWSDMWSTLSTHWPGGAITWASGAIADMGYVRDPANGDTGFGNVSLGNGCVMDAGTEIQGVPVHIFPLYSCDDDTGNALDGVRAVTMWGSRLGVIALGVWGVVRAADRVTGRHSSAGASEGDG